MSPKLKASLVAVTLLTVSIGNGEAYECKILDPSSAYARTFPNDYVERTLRQCKIVQEAHQRNAQQEADRKAAVEQHHRDKLERAARAQHEQEQRVQDFARREQEAYQQRLEAEARAKQQREREAQAEAKRHEEWKQTEAARREQERKLAQEEAVRQAERDKIELDRYRDEAAKQAEKQRAAQELAAKKAEIDREQRAKQQLAAQELAAKNAAIDRSSPAFPATNEEKGCELIQQVVPDYKNPPTRSSCQPMLETVKAGTEEVCVIALMATRMNALNEPVWQRPKGLTLVAQKACAMMKNGYGEAHVDRVTERMCSSSHDPQFISECRGAAYRN